MAKSGARQLVDLVWKHNREATGHSWQRLNSSMAASVRLAISAGMRFAVDDFASIYSGMRGGYWFGAGERFYTLAVEFDNISACQSYEAWKDRKPFIHGGRRLAIDSEMDHWLSREDAHRLGRLVVTSFASDGSYLTAVTYDGGKVMRITLEQLRSRERELEKSKKAAA